MAEDASRGAAPADISHVVDIEVRYAETDAMGVVHHANYLVWFELARTGLCARTGYDYPGVERAGYRILVTGAELRYLRGARYGDRVQVEVWLERLESRGLHFSYRVWRGGERLASGATSHLWIDAASGRVRRIPSPWREAFARFVRDGAPAA